MVAGGDQTTVGSVQQLASVGTAAVIGRLPQSRSDLVAASIGSTAYVLGGYDGAAIQPAVLATTDGRRFHAVATLPAPVRYPAVAVLGHAIYLFGGETAAGPTSAIQRIDPAAHAATIVGHLPHPLADAAALTLDGRVYVAGGTSAGSAQTQIRRFVPATGRTLPAGRLPYAVSDAGAAVLDGAGYLLGGESSDRLGTVIVLHPHD